MKTVFRELINNELLKLENTGLMYKMMSKENLLADRNYVYETSDDSFALDYSNLVVPFLFLGIGSLLACVLVGIEFSAGSQIIKL